jgi:hypothetical protein
MSTSQEEMGSRAYYDDSDSDTDWECDCKCECKTDSDSSDSDDDSRPFDAFDVINIISGNRNPRCKCLECDCVKPPAFEIDDAGEIKHTKGVININVDLNVIKYHKDIKASSYFKHGKWLKLGDIVPMGFNGSDSSNIVVGWSNDEFLSLPTQISSYGHHYAIEESHNDLETIKGNVDIKPLLKALADGVNSNF